MTTTWILVANASRAKLYTHQGVRKGLKLIKEFSHPASREKNIELVSDRSGHYQSAGGSGHGAFVAATDPKRHESTLFASELTAHLERARVANQYQRLIVAASPAFLGTLTRRFGAGVRGLLRETITKDYTSSNDRLLSGRLDKFIVI